MSWRLSPSISKSIGITLNPQVRISLIVFPCFYLDGFQLRVSLNLHLCDYQVSDRYFLINQNLLDCRLLLKFFVQFCSFTNLHLNHFVFLKSRNACLPITSSKRMGEMPPPGRLVSMFSDVKDSPLDMFIFATIDFRTTSIFLISEAVGFLWPTLVNLHFLYRLDEF